MEKWRVERVKAVLKDYRDTDKYVRKLEEEIRVPYREEDVNGDIKEQEVTAIQCLVHCGPLKQTSRFGD